MKDPLQKLDGVAEAMRQELLEILEQRLQAYFEAIESELPGLDAEAYSAELDKRVDVEALFEQICNEYREKLIGGKLH
jgi:vacuolar-type H+-ATPase subunit E/Vma4